MSVPICLLFAACQLHHVSHDMTQWGKSSPAENALHRQQYELAQITGQSWIAKTGSACKERTDGGCMIDYFTQLDFTQDSVMVTGTMKAWCSPPETEAIYNNQKHIKKYAWKMAGNKIDIPGTYVGPLHFINNTLVTDSASTNVHCTFSPLDK